MAKEGNLLVTFDPAHHESALKEISELLKEIKEKADILKAEEGVAEILVKDARKSVKNLVDIGSKDAGKFAYTSCWTPIDKWCKNSVEDMQKTIKGFVKEIKQNEKWKRDLKVRKVKEKPDEIKLIMNLTEVVDNPNVDLHNPDRIIKVEIIGNRAGLALLGRDELLNAVKLKQQK